MKKSLLIPDLTAEQTLSQKLAEFQMRVQYLESMYRAKQEDVSILSQYLGLTALAANNGSTSNGSNAGESNSIFNSLNNFNSVLESLSPESKAIIKNLTLLQSQQRFTSAGLRLPTAYHFLPHLLDDPASLRPAYLLSKGKTGVSIVLGIPTVKRDKQTYLLSTLDNLLVNMDDEEQNDTMIVVFVGETDLEYVTELAKQIQLRFSEYCENGLIEILSPPASYYPNFEKLRLTLGDPLERVKWRSKQNLDFAFLMSYAQTKATFYVQLEDDILAKRGYITIMKQFALAKTAKQDPWFVLDFCQLGFIGEYFSYSFIFYKFNLRFGGSLTFDSFNLFMYVLLSKLIFIKRLMWVGVTDFFWVDDIQSEKRFLFPFDSMGLLIIYCVEIDVKLDKEF